MKAALVASWAQPVPGRERKALEYGAEVNAYWSRLADEGRCSPPEMFFSDSGCGLWMVKGEREDLTELFATEDVRLLSLRGDLLLSDFSLELHHAGESADMFLATYSKALESIS